MTEASQVNGAVRQHLGPLGRFLRVEHAHAIGWADWYYVLRGRSGWLEAKLMPASGRCPEHFTREQLMWGQDEVNAGGRWHLLALWLRGNRRTWLLLDVEAAGRWYHNEAFDPVVEAVGTFPTKELVNALSPRGTP